MKIDRPGYYRTNNGEAAIILFKNKDGSVSGVLKHCLEYVWDAETGESIDPIAEPGDSIHSYIGPVKKDGNGFIKKIYLRGLKGEPEYE